jgi:FdhE protein
MPVQFASNQSKNNVSEAVETAIQKRPVLEPIIRLFAELVLETSRIARELKVASELSAFNIDPNRILQGVPVLAGKSFDPLHEQLNQSFRAILTVLKRTFSHLAEDFSSIESLQREGELDLSRLASAYFNGESSVIRTAAEWAETSEGTMAMALSSTLSAVLRALEQAMRDYITEAQWYRGYCPICGSMPSISYLAEAGDIGSEFLKGGGGQKYLHCSLCGHDWRFMRDTCPGCDTEDKDLRLYFQLEGEHSERVDICRNCGAYLPCIDLRESAHKMPLDIAAISMIHLDVWASEKGYHPLARTLWNVIQ